MSARSEEREARQLARREFAKAIAAGKSGSEAGAKARAAVKAQFPNIDPATLAAIIEFIRMLIALFSK